MCLAQSHALVQKDDNSSTNYLFCSFKYSFYYYTLGPILSTGRPVVNKDELKFNSKVQSLVRKH